MRVIILSFLFAYLPGRAQEFSLRLVVEDAVGHSDTIYYGHDPDCTDLIDSTFGEIDLSDIPWDTTLDARFVVEYPSVTQTKGLCTWVGIFNDCYQSFERLAVSTEHWPITIRWDSAQVTDACQEFMGISCSDILWNGDYSCDFNVPFQIVDFRTTSSASFETAIPNREPCYAIEGVPQNARFIYFDFTPQGVGIGEDNGLQYVNVWPIPANIFINIEWQHQGEAEIRLLDMTGKEVIRKQSHEQRETIDVSSLSSGLYLLQLVQGEVRSSMRIVVER